MGDDICRVCHTEETAEEPLFYPCLCRGTIKYVHQGCLLQWLKATQNEYCELCSHKFTLQPVYCADMPDRLPVGDVVAAVCCNAGTTAWRWFNYCTALIVWLILLPFIACYIYRDMFCLRLWNASAESGLTFTYPLGFEALFLVSTDNFQYDYASGCVILLVSLFALGLVGWLHQQVTTGHVQWLDAPAQQPNQAQGGQQDNNVAEPANQGPELQPAQPAVNMADIAVNHILRKVFGLDGPLALLARLVGVIVILHLIIFTFAFCPYQIGYMCAIGCGLWTYLKSSHFEGFVVTVLGYLLVCVCMFSLHMLTKIYRTQRWRRVTGFAYLVAKVSMLLLVKIVLVPFTCGFFIDLCSLKLFASTLIHRFQSLNSMPFTWIYLHWLVGIVSALAAKSYFISPVQNVLRPGLLGKVSHRSKIQQLMEDPVYQLLRPSIVRLVVCAITSFLMVYVPVEMILKLFPALLPYRISFNVETGVSGLWSELAALLLLLVGSVHDIASACKTLIRHWCDIVGHILNLAQYLLPAQTPDQHQEVTFLAHGYQPYAKPSYFAIRLAALLVCVAVSVVAFGFIALTIPVIVGRREMRGYIKNGGKETSELYTLFTGMCTCLMLKRMLRAAAHGAVLDQQMAAKWVVLGCKCLAASFGLFQVVPMLMGVLLELVILIPLRIPLNQTYLLFLEKYTHFGDDFDKMTAFWCMFVAVWLCAAIMNGPHWWLKTALQRTHDNGVFNMDLTHMYTKLIGPTCFYLGVPLTVPYLLGKTLAPVLCNDIAEQLWLERYIYPCSMVLIIAGSFAVFIFKRYQKFLIKMRNDKYSIGQILVNYGRNLPIYDK